MIHGFKSTTLWKSKYTVHCWCGWKSAANYHANIIDSKRELAAHVKEGS